MIDAKMVRNIATKYIYDRCPAVVGVGKKSWKIAPYFLYFSRSVQLENHFEKYIIVCASKM